MRLKRWAVLATFVLCAVLALGIGGCGAKKAQNPPATAPAPASEPVVIVEENYEFTPATVEVKVGDKVVFENNDSAAHRVAVNGQDLGQQSKGQSVTWTATAAGTLPFACTIHPDMAGQITVK